MNDGLTATANSGGSLAFTGSTFDLGANRLAVTGANNTSISNVISGTGDILKQGAGILLVTGNNTFGSGTSNVFMDQGTISVGTGGTLGATDGSTTGLINMGSSAAGGLNTVLNSCQRCNFSESGARPISPDRWQDYKWFFRRRRQQHFFRGY